MESKNIQKTLIIPFVKYEEVIKYGEKHHEPKNNLTNTDLNYLEVAGYKPVFLTNDHINGCVKASELPLYFNGGTSIKGFICYLYDDLSEEDKTIFKDKTEEIDLLIREEKNIGEKVEIPKKTKKRFFSRSK